MTKSSPVIKSMLVLAALGGLASLSPAAAQVRYAPAQQPYFGFFNQPYDESYGTQPSYQIVPNADRYGRPVVRVIQRCAYLNGWNVGDFSRDVNGTPLGVDHTCPDDDGSAQVRARY